MTVATDQPSIEVMGLGRRDPKTQLWLLRDVSFGIHSGDRLGIVGRSGAGKTLLLRALAMLDRLDEGSIYWHGQAVGGNAIPAYRRRVVYLHQRPALFEGTVEQNLRYPFALQAYHDRAFDRNRVIELLKRMGREPTFLDRSSRDLSGGEAQIVAFARALQLEPSVLLLDEPTASLDPSAALTLEALLEQWLTAQRDERALVWVSHDRDQTVRMTERRIALRAGRLESEE